MTQSILTRYLQPDVLNQIADQRFEPRLLVEGNLAGAHKSPLSGFAVEFAGHREYVPGDDPKHIDWRVYYNRDKLFIKQYEMETNFVCHLALDVSASMRYGQGETQKLRCAAQAALTLACCILRQSDQVALLTFDQGVNDALPPSNSLAQLTRMIEQLDRVQPVKKTDLGASLGELAQRVRRREIVMVFSDFFAPLDTLEPALQRLRYDRHEVVLFQIMHADELEFRLPGRVKFVGLEQGDTLLADPADIRERYLAALHAHNAALVELCQRNRCEHVLLDTSRPLAETLASYLNQRTLHRRSP